MSDSIKFGPEWLRNMSNDTSSLSSATATSAGGGNGNRVTDYAGRVYECSSYISMY